MHQKITQTPANLHAEKKSWYKHSFSEDYFYLYAHRNDQEALFQVKKSIEFVPFSPGQHVLDIACGAGRHILAFAKLGAKVTGIDLSEPLLKRAQSRFAEYNFPSVFIQLDMRQLDFRGTFDGVTMWFTSFGYFQNPADNLKVLHNIRKALKPGGWWWIDLANPDFLIRELIPQSKRYIDGPFGKATVREFREIIDRRVQKYIELEDEKGPRHYVESVRLYDKKEFKHLAESAGLKPQGVLGDYDGSFFAIDTPRQIWFGTVE